MRLLVRQDGPCACAQAYGTLYGRVAGLEDWLREKEEMTDAIVEGIETMVNGIRDTARLVDRTCGSDFEGNVEKFIRLLVEDRNIKFAQTHAMGLVGRIGIDLDLCKTREAMR